MSGKSAGKKRNRAAQSEQHGYQESPTDLAGKAGKGKGNGEDTSKTDRKRTIDKLRELQQRRRDREGQEKD